MRSKASLHTRFARLGRWLATRPRAVVAVSAAVLAVAAVYGSSVEQHLPIGGTNVIGSQSERVAREIESHFGVGSPDLLLLYRNADGYVRSPVFGSAVMDSLDPVLDDPGVISAITYYDTKYESFVSRDGRETLALLSLAGDESEKLETYRRIEPLLREVEPPLHVEIGGPVAASMLSQQIAHRDVVAAETVALPVAALLALLFFRGVVAALLPVAIGGFALACSAALVRLGAQITPISIFAMNVGAFLGLGLSIDYALLLVQRFREELGRRPDVGAAVAATLDTAGRAIWVSGITVAVSLAVLLPVHLPVLRSLAIGGILVVVSALVGALGVLPALLGWLGPNVDRWRISRDPIEAGPSRFWFRVGGLSMRHPIAAVVVSVAVLATAASPALRMRTALPDSRVLPRDSEVRKVDGALENPARFDPRAASAIPVVVEMTGPGLAPDNLRALRAYAARLAALPGVSDVQSPADDLDPDALSPDELQRAIASEPTATKLQRTLDGSTALLVVETPHSWRDPETADLVRALRGVRQPGLRTLVGGGTAEMLDLVDALRDYAPVALALIALWNFAVLLAAFRSVVVPIKAVLMNVLSLGASYGVLVWVFQEGHGAAWLNFEPVSGIDPTIPLVMFAIVFGLSMDYEVFLLSRIQEEWRRTRDNRTSVIRGLAHTGRIITSAALILLVVVGSFAAGNMVYVKQIGLGMVAAIALDVTLVRALLVPATMQLLGAWNWWLPGALRRGLLADRDPVPGSADASPS